MQNYKTGIKAFAIDIGKSDVDKQIYNKKNSVLRERS